MVCWRIQLLCTAATENTISFNNERGLYFINYFVNFTVVGNK